MVNADVKVAILYKLDFPNGKSYIGITRETLKRRLDRHITYARNGKKFLISKAIRKYGELGFASKILAIGEFDYIKDLEIKAISVYETFGGKGYNMTNGGEGMLGVTPSKDTRNKISMSLLGRELTAEHKANISKSQNIGGVKKSIPEETRLKMSLAKKGKSHSAETKKKIKDSVNAFYKR